MAKSGSCFKCAHQWSFEPPFGRKDECPACRWDAHVCLNCQFYDRGAHHQCREPQADLVQDKEKSNFCDYFEMLAIPRGAADTAQASHKEKLENLFSKQPQKITESDSKKKSLEDELAAFLKNK